MNFGAKESMAPEVVADTGSHINQEVVGAVVAGTEGEAVVGGLEAVKAGGLPTDSAKQIGAYLFVEARLVNGIEVEKDGAISLAEPAEVSNGSPGGIKAGANPALENNVGTNVGVESATLGANEVYKRRGAASRSSGRHYGSESEHGVGLLSGCESGQRKKDKNNRKEGELSQVKPPVMISATVKMQSPNRLDAIA